MEKYHAQFEIWLTVNSTKQIQWMNYQNTESIYTLLISNNKNYNCQQTWNVSSCNSGVTQSKPLSKISSWDLAFSGPSPIVGSSALYASNFCWTSWASSTLPSNSPRYLQNFENKLLKILINMNQICNIKIAITKWVCL